MNRCKGYIFFSAMLIILIIALIFGAQMYYYYVRSTSLKKTIDYKSAEILVNLAKTNNLGNNDVMIYSKGEVEKNSNVYSVKLKGGQIITIMTTKDN